MGWLEAPINDFGSALDPASPASSPAVCCAIAGGPEAATYHGSCVEPVVTESNKRKSTWPSDQAEIHTY